MNVEPLTGLPILQIKIKQNEIARHGVPAKAVLDLVESLGGMRLSEIVEGQFRFPLVIRLPEKYRGTVKDSNDAKELIEEIPVLTAKGEHCLFPGWPRSRYWRIALRRSPANGASAASR